MKHRGIPVKYTLGKHLIALENMSVRQGVKAWRRWKCIKCGAGLWYGREPGETFELRKHCPVCKGIKTMKRTRALIRVRGVK